MPVVAPSSSAAMISVVPQRLSQTPASASLPSYASAAASQQVQTPVCPPAGTRWATSSWSAISEGADPASPTTCLRTTGGGRNHRLIYGFRAVGNVSDDSVIQGMASLFPLALGRSADFIFVGRTVRFAEYQYRETFNVISEEVIQVGSERRGAWVIRRVEQGLGDNTSRVEETHWVDKETGVWLRRVMVDVQGVSPNRGFNVISLTRNQ